MKVSIAKIKLNRGGYSSKGRYFGVGPPALYKAETLEGDTYIFRANDREDAKKKVDAWMLQKGYSR